MIVLYGIFAVCFYGIIGAGVWGILTSSASAIVDYEDYTFLTVVLWPLITIMELLLQFCCYVYEIYRELKEMRK